VISSNRYGGRAVWSVFQVSKQSLLDIYGTTKKRGWRALDCMTAVTDEVSVMLVTNVGFTFERAP